MKNIIAIISITAIILSIYFLSSLVNLSFTVSLILFIAGSCFGSFAVATVWRLRLLQLSEEKSDSEKMDKTEKKEYARLKSSFGKTSFFSTGKNLSKDRSVCLNCGHKLSVSENIPILSWLFLAGKCKKCHKPIGYAEILAEIGTGFLFLASYIFWPFSQQIQLNSPIEIFLAVLWLIVVVCLVIHTVYDFKWLILLDKVTIVLLVFSILIVIVSMLSYGSMGLADTLTTIVKSLLILPVFYAILFFASKGQWIGFGDVKLLVPLSIMLPSWSSAFLVLFLSNVIGLIFMLPGIITKKITRQTRIPFGPFLIMAFFVTMFFGEHITKLYFGIFGV